MIEKDILEIIGDDGPLMRCARDEPKIKLLRHRGKMMVSEEHRNSSWNAFKKAQKLSEGET